MWSARIAAGLASLEIVSSLPAQQLRRSYSLASASPDEPTVNVWACVYLVVEVGDTKAPAQMWSDRGPKFLTERGAKLLVGFVVFRAFVSFVHDTAPGAQRLETSFISFHRSGGDKPPRRSGTAAFFWLT